ncbi:HNH endonuclease [Bacillus mobilis]|uniref:HNH endonuclease n=1 Tax=Bacillus mobilis TaxID=2026190 RepID=UPI002E1C0E1F|nr:HNH endonuclease [Bacillus mobilis]
MKNLVPPSLDSKAVYDDIQRNARSQDKITRLERLKPHVFSRYDDYELNVLQLEMISPSSIIDSEDKKAMESCYNRSSQGYLEGKVVQKILSIQTAQYKNKCPYCGIDKPRTIDHYLPKSNFPEFSIYPPNLIPCCGHCNTRKNDRWLDGQKRMFLNLYYDELPKDEQFIFSSLSFVEELSNPIPLITFELRNSGNINSDLFDIIKNHYRYLGLLKEFSLIVEAEISNIFDKIIHNTNLPRETHKDNLQMEYAMLVRKYGINHWKAAFIMALIQSDEFFERAYLNADRCMRTS